MPRLPRQKSRSEIYHIMLRGINQQVIFEDTEDYIRFIETMQKYKAVSGYKVFAYCLMSNHIHILLKAENEEIDLIMKRVAGSYVYWYNQKYYRRGHLFQDRYKSEPVEDESFFLTVLRYIHQNPVKAGIVEKLDEYEYSSYNEYIHGSSDLVDIDYVKEIITDAEFVEYHNEENGDKCLEIEERSFRINDKDASKMIKQISGCDSTTEFQLIEQGQRDKYIKKLKQKGLSIRQISRLTGVSKGVVEKI